MSIESSFPGAAKKKTGASNHVEGVITGAANMQEIQNTTGRATIEGGIPGDSTSKTGTATKEMNAPESTSKSKTEESGRANQELAPGVATRSGERKKISKNNGEEVIEKIPGETQAEAAIADVPESNAPNGNNISDGGSSSFGPGNNPETPAQPGGTGNEIPPTKDERPVSLMNLQRKDEVKGQQAERKLNFQPVVDFIAKWFDGFGF